MDISENFPADKPAPVPPAAQLLLMERPMRRRFSWDRDGSKRRAGSYAELLSLRYETFLLRCKLADPRNDSRRALLATRLDVVDARAAHIAARLLEVAA